MVRRLVLILGDQLSHANAALKLADPATDLVVMAEVMAEGKSVPHHPQKIALILSAMRHFAKELRENGWTVSYSQLDDPENAQSIQGELLRLASRHGVTKVLSVEPGEWRLREVLQSLPLDVTLLEDRRFLCTHSEFSDWAKGRKQLRMEWFYREMRRKTGLLMDGEQPAGGKWNFDHDNRKAASPDLFRPRPETFAPDDVTTDVLNLVEQKFPKHFGRLRPFRWAVTRDEAVRAFDHFLRHQLPSFGDEQDAMLRSDPTLSHALISAYLNIGLLDPLEVCQKAEAEWREGRAALNAVEGFIRQIIGWREYIRGIYWLQGPDYLNSNALGAQRDLPALYWGAPTKLACLSHAVEQTRDLAYAHHIQRLMVTGNFALLIGANPAQVHEWYLSVYIDAFEWVEAPNTLGMSQFADGGLLGSKPYAASGAYIDRMSDYCGTCHYRVKERTGERACPLNALYWDFLDRHRQRFERNPRMAQMYRTFDRMAEDQRAAVLAKAADFLARLDAGETI